MRRVTIKDIARLSGVSVTTVSRALNDAPEINRETRDRVLEVCREQGYRTNLLARSLISSRSNMLGLVVPDISSPYHATLSLHVELCAREAGYQVMVCGSQSAKGGIEGLFDLFLSQRVDGILLCAGGGVPSRYGGEELPCVLLGTCALEDEPFRANTVSVDNYTGGRMAAEYLHSLGHRDAVYLGFREGSVTHILRRQGFLDAAGDLGMTVETVRNPHPASTIQSGCHMAREFLGRPFSQTAVFAASDAVALGVMQVADELGVSIPGRLSILGFDDIEYAALPNIRLTTLSQNTPKLVRSAVRLLLELIESGDHTEYTRKLITPAVIRRATCRAVE